jgi:three-Cys-motif partner protein
MSDELPTIWPAEQHTLAKHGILKSYLDAWAAILSNPQVSDSPELLFVDAFAGPGEYSTGEPGSPLVALNAVLNHTRELQKPVRFKFIESRKDRFDHLRSRIATERTKFASSTRVIVDEPIHGDCDTELGKLIGQRDKEHKPLGPALFFLDQFGYSQVPMTLLKKILTHDQCEAFSYLNCQRMNHFLDDKTKWLGITEAYGDESWRPAIDLQGHQRQTYLIEAYKEAIRRNAGVKYVWSFAMFNINAQLIHWLIFSSGSVRGLEEMKRAMWKADKQGDFRFSDRIGISPQTTFFSVLKDDWLADDLVQKLAGQTVSERDLKEFVLTKTPFYLYKTPVNLLRKSGRVAPATKGAFPVTFRRA